VSSLVPTIFDLPFIEFGGARVYLLADLPEGARISWAARHGLEVLHSNVIGAGAMLVVVGPDQARDFRPLKVSAPANPLELAPPPFVSIGPVNIPVLVDVATDLEATITRGLVPGGAVIRVPVVPAGSLVATLAPELAAHIRPMIAAAFAEAQRQLAAQRNGPLGLVQ
jgi:hypothetical protein